MDGKRRLGRFEKEKDDLRRHLEFLLFFSLMFLVFLSFFYCFFASFSFVLVELAFRFRDIPGLIPMLRLPRLFYSYTRGLFNLLFFLIHHVQR